MSSHFENTSQEDWYNLLCMRILGRKVLLKPSSTHALESQGVTASSFFLSLDFDREKGWHEGSPTPVFYLPFLASCGYTLGPSPTNRAWRLPMWGQDSALPRHVKKNKCNCLWVKVPGGLRNTGCNSWLCNGSSSWPRANYLICPCLGTKPCAPRKSVPRLYLLIFDSRCAGALLQRVRGVGSRLGPWMMSENRAIHHADELQFLSSFTSSFIPRVITSCVYY